MNLNLDKLINIAVRMDIIKKSLVRISELNIFESDIPIIGKTKTIFNMLDPTIFPITRFPFFVLKRRNDGS